MFKTTEHDNFIYRGNKYYIGTKVKPSKQFFKKHDYSDVILTVIQHITSESESGNTMHEYVVQLSKRPKFYTGDLITTIYFPPDNWIEEIIQEATTPPEIKPEFYKDKEVDGVMDGWLTYIVVMLLGSIFYIRFIIWIAASIVFFRWRKKKLTKPASRKYM